MSKKNSKTRSGRSNSCKAVSGTREWAAVNVNIVLGCEHRCRYCYARAMAKRFHRIETDEEWGTTLCRVRLDEVNKRRRNYGGKVMFPTSHDITPQFLDDCVTVLRNLLEARNEVLVVSKPHLACIERLCAEFAGFHSPIFFRFTIGAADDQVLGYWEPGAPGFQERLASLQHAYEQGFQTSVSIEPMLDVPNVVDLFQTLKPYVTHSIWLGKMNDVRRRVPIQTPEDEWEVQRIIENQTDDRIREVYERLKDEPLARWKESVKKVVGLAVATEAGLDE